MDRRKFLELAFTTAAFAAANVPGRSFAATRDEWATAFRAALAEKPWLLGWLGVDAQRLETPALEIEGKLPAALTGTLYRNGPARQEHGGLRYRHWFDGDGMVQAFRFGGGGVSHLGRLVATDKLIRERKAGRRLRPAFGTDVPDAEPVRRADDVNTANTSVLSHGGRLFALWEGGSPYVFDPVTLETGGKHRWSPETAGLPFSAHPRIDADGSLWSIGCASFADTLILYHIGADGRLRTALPVRLDGVPMVHDFVVTERHLLVVLPPLESDRSAGPTILDQLVWRPERPARVLIVDKNDLSAQRLLEMPAHFAFHYGNAWEDRAGIVRMDMCRYPDASVLTDAFRYLMRGEARPGAPARHYVVSIDPAAGAIVEEPIGDHTMPAEFPYVDRRVSGRRYRRVTLLLRDSRAATRHPHLNAVGRLDMETGRLDSYAYGPTSLPEEHIFVPRPGGAGEDDGWILGTSLDFAAAVTRLAVFDAARIADGPLAVASLPYALPLGLHGAFVAG